MFTFLKKSSAQEVCPQTLFTPSSRLKISIPQLFLKKNTGFCPPANKQHHQSPSFHARMKIPT